MCKGCDSVAAMRRPLRATLSLVLAASLGVLPLSLPAPALAEDPSAEETEARKMYSEGESAYRLGRFEEAAVKFERAYELSHLPGLLYNIGLSYKRKYDLSTDVADLRKAKTVFENYLIELARDPELGDREEAENLVAETDAMIKKHEDEEEAARAAAAGNRPAGPTGPDPGKKDRLAGVIMMSTGGVLALGGAAFGVVMALRGNEFTQDLEDCKADPSCSDSTRNTIIDNGQKANRLGLGIAIPLAVAGTAVLGAGVGVFIRGDKKTKAWQKSKVSVAPAFSGTFVGVGVSGRF